VAGYIPRWFACRKKVTDPRTYQARLKSNFVEWKQAEA